MERNRMNTISPASTGGRPISVLVSRSSAPLPGKRFLPIITPRGIPSSADIPVEKTDMTSVVAMICHSSLSPPKISPAASLIVSMIQKTAF